MSKGLAYGARAAIQSWRGGPTPFWRWAWPALLLLLAPAFLELPNQVGETASALQIASRWTDRRAQMREVVGADFYDALVDADRLLPSDATVMLVTTGQDVRHGEYTAFHRALYLLAPRPVWWVAPVERDGTWESRWWTPTSMEPDTLERQARAFGATHLLSFATSFESLPGERVQALAGGSVLTALDGASQGTGGSTVRHEIDWSWPLRLLAAIAVILLAGHMLVEHVIRPDWEPHWTERRALEWLLGAGAVSLAMYWLGLLGMRLPGQMAVIAALAAAGTVVSQRRSVAAVGAVDRDVSTLGSRPPGRGLGRPLIVCFLAAWLLAQLTLVGLQAVGRPLKHWDSWVTWGMRARVIYLHNGRDQLLAAHPSRTVTLQHYPPLVPLIEAWTYGWLGTPDDRFAGVQAVFFFAALLGLVFGALRQRAPLVYALCIVVALGSLIHISGLAGIVFADIPLAANATAAAIAFRRWLAGGSKRTLVMAATLAGMTAFTKSEGLLLVAVLAASGLVATALLSSGREGSRRSILGGIALGVGVVAVAGLWYARAAALGVGAPIYQPFTLATFIANAERMPRILALFATRALQPEWHALWPAMGLVTVGLLFMRRSVRPLFLMAVMLYLAAINLVYVFSDFLPVDAHVLSSADRLMAHVAPLAVLWLAELPFGSRSVGTPVAEIA